MTTRYRKAALDSLHGAPQVMCNLHKQLLASASMLSPRMSDDNDVVPGSTVAEVAVELSRRHPHREPLQILDEAIAGRWGDELDFEFDTDELRPPHPFAVLLRRAFAPEIDPVSLSPQRRWNLIVLPFARRYRIWEPDHTSH